MIERLKELGYDIVAVKIGQTVSENPCRIFVPEHSSENTRNEIIIEHLLKIIHKW